ncbi:uncharacterized protein BDV14DRAFT_180621 [Aspergillus stella-maris]|uniref:uncharacterized protein n=1 Tax=Aspergillus stella-maris TaxID=1810926 RepID=UPI003CCD90AF
MDVDLWFRDWRSKFGQRLSSKQQTRLAALTRQWRHGRAPDPLHDWASNPSTKFWGFAPFHTESAWVRECLKLPAFKDCHENTEDCRTDDCVKVSARRRVLLIILHDIIQEEVLRLRASSHAQSVKYITTAIRNIVEQAYPGSNNQQLRDKCTHLRRYGQKYSSLAREELVLAPLQGTSSSFERTKVKDVDLEALVAFGEVIYDKNDQNNLQTAFKLILNTCPYKQTKKSKPRFASKSTRNRRRRKAARAMDSQKPSAHFNSFEPRADPFSYLEELLDSRNRSLHGPGDILVEQVSEEILSSLAKARNATLMQPEEHLFDSFELCFNPSESLEHLPKVPRHDNALLYGTCSANADLYFNPSAFLESLPGTFQQSDMHDMSLEEAQPLNYLPRRFNPSGYLETLPQPPQNSIALNTEATLEEAQPLNYLPRRFNPSGYLETLPQPPQNSITFNTEATTLEFPYLKPPDSLESQPGKFRSSNAPLLNNTQPFKPLEIYSNSSGSLNHLIFGPQFETRVCLAP